MALNISVVFLGLISCLLVTGGLCLECYVCNISDAVCSNTSTKNCTEPENICSAVTFSTKIGNEIANRTVKRCETGSPKNSITRANSYGIQILHSWHSCNTTKCNENVPDLSKEFAQNPDSSTSSLECYSCFSTNKTKCSKGLAKTVKCPVGHNTCFDASGTLTIGNDAVPIFVKQCYVPTNVTTIVIHTDQYTLSLIALYCKENLCNENLSFTTASPTAPAASVTHSTVKTNQTTKVPPLPTTIKTTTSGIGITHPCYVVLAMIILGVIESLL